MPNMPQSLAQTEQEGDYTHNMYDAQPGPRNPGAPISGEYEQAR